MRVCAASAPCLSDLEAPCPPLVSGCSPAGSPYSRGLRGGGLIMPGVLASQQARPRLHAGGAPAASIEPPAAQAVVSHSRRARCTSACSCSCRRQSEPWPWSEQLLHHGTTNYFIIYYKTYSCTAVLLKTKNLRESRKPSKQAKATNGGGLAAAAAAAA
eukprot:SAG22_NODE_10516_length_530_cov_1.060325_1_plen_158_part_10